MGLNSNALVRPKSVHNGVLLTYRWIGYLPLIDSRDYRRRRVPFHRFNWEPFRLKPTQGLSWPGTVEPQPPPEQALGLSSIVSLSHTRKPSSRSIDHSQASYTGAHTRRHTTILPLQNNSLRPVKVRSSEELTELITINCNAARVLETEKG